MDIRRLYYTFRFYSLLHQNRKCKTQGENHKVFVFLAADYGNLGDVAITYAQEKLLKERFPGYEIIDVPISRTLSLLHPIKKSITPHDIVTITGGGNMGEAYGDIELLRLMVIRMFPKNKIVVFPQTVDYSGENTYLFRLAKRTYCNHHDLTILAREEMSYDRIRELLPKVNVQLTPDVVMTLDERRNANRSGIVFCLRNDKEKSSQSIKADELRKEAEEMGLQVIDYDTHISKDHMVLSMREDELAKIWSTFSSTRLVVTDRLHGMIFAYITGTPAIVFPNSNFKVEKCFEWIRNSGYIHFCKDGRVDLNSALNVQANSDCFEKNHTRFGQIIMAAI